MNINNILDWLFPRKCLHCGLEGGYICQDCIGQIDFIKNQCCPNCRKIKNDGCFCGIRCAKNFHFDQLIICLDYKKNSLFQKLLIQFKYHFSEDLKDLLGRIMKLKLAEFSHLLRNAEETVEGNIDKLIFIPVPLDSGRLKYRGFNQSLLLAEYLRKSFINAVIFDCLKRAPSIIQQAKLDRKHRLENLLNRISINKQYKNKLSGKTVILVDDVASTCTTLNECASCLKEAGVKFICGLVLARGKFQNKS